MIYIFMALYQEAESLIRHYHLKKDVQNTRFQVFFNEEAGIRLGITGVGSIAAAAAVSSVCTEYHAGCGDFLLNIGTGAAVAQSGDVGEVFLCNKLVEAVTGRTFYPDVLYGHDFFEGCLVTGAKPLDGAAGRMEEFAKDTVIYDMEAAAVYQAGAYFFGPHQMSFLKVITDCGAARSVTAEQLKAKMTAATGAIAAYIDSILRTLAEEKADGRADAKKQMEDVVRHLCVDLHCSKTMEAALRQQIRYCVLSGSDYTAVIQGMYAAGKLPCKDKREGKMRFEELKSRLL